jgi:mRNA interferase MazF
VIARGDIRWADLEPPPGSAPGYRRPVVVISADSFNASAIATVICVAVTGNLALAVAPGNVPLPSTRSGLDRESVANVSQVVTLDKRLLDDPVGRLDEDTMGEIAAGLRLALALDVL